MTKRISALLATSLVASTLLADGVVLVQKSERDVTKLTPTSKAWEYVKATTIHLYPQTALVMNDEGGPSKGDSRRQKHSLSA